MKRLLKRLIYISILSFIYSSTSAQYTNTVYIDPTNSNDPQENGSIAHPYDDIADINWQSNTSYRLKRGTSLTTTARVDFDGLHDTRFGVYGPGNERPIVTRTSNGGSVRFSRMNRCWVDSIRFIQPVGMGGSVIGHGGSSSASDPWCYNAKVTNCEMANAGAGFWSYPYSTGSDTLFIINCEVHDMTSDGIFINSCDNILIEGCHIYDVNTYWFTNPVDADGDGIHLVKECNNYKIYNNIIDKSNTGKKFSFIFGGTNVEPVYGEIVGNTFIPPHIEYGSSAIYISKKQTKVLVARNYITGRRSPSSYPGYIPGSTCYLGADTTIFEYNIIDSINNGGVFTQDVSYFEFNNNTVVSPMPSSYLVNLTGPGFGQINNNLSAGDCSNGIIRYSGSNTTSSNNTEINTSNSSQYNSGLGIIDWETSNFQRTSNANDGIDIGLVYDYDSLLVNNPPERGSCEFDDGSQTNDPPTISNQEFTIDENTIEGSEVGLIEATDPNQGQSLSFSIQAGNTNNAFAINTSTGVLTVNNSGVLDFETTPQFNLNIQVQDNGIGYLMAQAMITIHLTNINELDQPATWIDNNSSNWDIPSNWNTGLVPDENTLVIITGDLQNYPEIGSGEINIGSAGTGAYNSRSISIEEGGKIELKQNIILNINSDGSLTILDGGELSIGASLNVNSGGSLNVLGGMVTCSFDGKVNGDINFNDGSNGYMENGSLTVYHTLHFAPGTNWTVDEGTIYCAGSSDEVLIEVQNEDLVIDNLEIAPGVSVQFVNGSFNYPLIINGDFTLGANSKFTNNQGKEILVGGEMLLNSDHTGTSSLVNYGSIEVTGPIEVQNYLEADRWHYISSPLSNDTAGVFMDMFLYAFDEYTYDPYSPTPSGWINIVDENVSLDIGKGYKVWSFTSMLGSEKVSFTKGDLNDGDITLPVTASDQDLSGTIGDGEGWNLLGNPYPSGIEWDHPSWLTQNIIGSVYVFDGIQYLAWSGSLNIGSLTDGIIPAMQAFFIKAKDFEPLLSITNESRTHGGKSYKDNTHNNLLILKVEGNGYEDKTYLHFNLKGDIKFNTNNDAYKLKGIQEAPQLFTYKNDNILSINVLPEMVLDTSVALGFEVSISGEYNISADMLDSFNPEVGIYLEDKVQNQLIDLRKQNNYEFFASSDDEPQRLYLHFNKSSIPENDLTNLDNQFNVYTDGKNISIKNLSDSPIQTRFLLYNISGQQIMNKKIVVDDVISFSPLVKTGFYIVKLVTDSNMQTQKILLR